MSDTQMELTESKGRQVAAPYTGDDPVMAAISNGLPVEVIEKIVEMKYRDEDRKAEQKFNEAFARMQADFTAVKKDKKSHLNTYASLNAIVKHYSPVLSAHGFSYRWNEEMLENGSKRVTCFLTGYGHTETSVFDIPPIEGNKGTNAAQNAAIMSTYGKRYTFGSVTGAFVEEEDADGNLTFEDAGKYQEYIAAIQATETIEDLKKKWSEIYKKFNAEDDAKGIQVGLKIQREHKALIEKKMREGK